MKQILSAIGLMLVATHCFGQAISIRNLDTNFFKTQTNVAPYNVTLNTNAGSGFSNYVYKVITNTSPQVWTNDNGLIKPVGLGVSGANGTNALLFITTNSATPGDGGNAEFRAQSGHQPDSGNRALWFNAGTYALLGENKSIDLGVGAVSPGETVAVFGYGASGLSWNYGVVGASSPNWATGQTNIGVAGSTIQFGNSGVFVSGFFAASTDASQVPVAENAILLGDNFDTGYPLLILRTNNGTVMVKVSAIGDVINNFGRFIGNGIGLTNIHLAGLQQDSATSGQVVTWNGTTWVAAGVAPYLREPTNSWAGPSANIDLALCTNGTAELDFTTTADCTITGFINKPTTNSAYVILTVTNSTGSDHTMTLPGPVTTDDGVRVYTITNKLARSFWIKYSPNNYTNASSRLWY